MRDRDRQTQTETKTERQTDKDRERKERDKRKGYLSLMSVSTLKNRYSANIELEIERKHELVSHSKQHTL